MATEEIHVERALDGRTFRKKTEVGRRLTVGEVMEEVLKDNVFYGESGGGVTFSGGEPLMQPEFLAELLLSCRKAGINTAVDTCGYALPSVVERIAGLPDLWLYDLKLMDDLQHVEFTGVSNELILQNLEILARKERNVMVRFPVIPGITDAGANLEGIAETMRRLRLTHLTLLPYHATAGHKYRRLGKDYGLEGTQEPGDEKMKDIENFFRHNGLDVYR